jgi:hypothetical protein
MDYWTFFSGEAERGHSPLYARLALGIGQDEQLKALAAKVRPGQPQANILLGAAHYLLLNGADHPVADHYPSVRPQAKPSGDPMPLFRDFILAHEGPLMPLIERKVTNTNEVARSSSLYPAFDSIARETRDALHLVEIGPSAGFNLNFDRYTYAYMRDGQAVVSRGRRDASLNLSCALRGDATPPLGADMPIIASRMGLERDPINLNRADERGWLKALIWPELTERHARLELAIRSQLDNPPKIWAGDALDLLDTALSYELPPKGVAAVYHSHVTYQFSEAMRERLDRIIRDASHRRPIYRVSIEFDGGVYPVRIGRYEKGDVSLRVLAHCDPHGTWLEWRG